MQLDWPFLLPQKLKLFFTKLLSSKNYSHAYFFVGVQGTNKKITAINFAKSILCQTDDDSTNLPCGKCSHCQQIDKMIHPDLFLIDILDNNKNISIEQIRELTQKLSLKAFLAEYKIVIIYQADKMTEEAANALLKNLEEPAPQTIFILISENSKFLPETIISRCQVVRFSPVSKDEMLNYFSSQNIDKSETDNLYRFSQGLPGLLADYLENSDLWIEEYEEVKQRITQHNLALPQQFKIIKDNFLTKNYNTEKQLILHKEIELWLKIFRDILLIKLNLNNLSRYRELNLQLERLASHYSLTEVLGILNELIKLNKNSDVNLNTQLTLENMYLNII